MKLKPLAKGRRISSASLARAVAALALAVALWTYVANVETPEVAANYTGLPVELRNVPADLVVVNDPGTATVRIRGPETVVRNVSPSDFSVYADLSAYGAGQHEVRLQSSRPPGITSYSIDPPTTPVTLETRAERVVPVRVQTSGSVPFGFELKSPEAIPAQITLSGPASQVSQVSRVVADVSVDGERASINKPVRPVAVDDQGRPVSRVSLKPEEVQVVVPIETKLGYKTLSIKPILSGEPAPGYLASAITVNPATVTVIGDPSVLDPIEFVQTSPIDLRGARSSISRSVEITPPRGVSVYGRQEVTVDITISPLQTKLVVTLIPSFDNLGQDLNAVASPDKLNVTLNGSLVTLQALQLSDVRAVIDVNGLSEGTYQLTPTIKVPDSVSVGDVSPARVTVTLLNRSRPPTNP